MALRNDGTVVAWGASAKRQTSVPAGLGDVTAIAAGLEFTLALKVDGSVISWGSSIGIPPAAAQSEVSAIPAGGGYSLALEVDGKVINWGIDSRGESGVPPVGRSKFIARSFASGPGGFERRRRGLPQTGSTTRRILTAWPVVSMIID